MVIAGSFVTVVSSLVVLAGVKAPWIVAREWQRIYRLKEEPTLFARVVAIVVGGLGLAIGLMIVISEFFRA